MPATYSRGQGDAVDVADLAAIAAGDRLALGRLYERHRQPLFAFILRVTSRDRGMAEEALQDTLLAVWQHAGSFAGGSQVRTWMYAIARRKALSAVRKRRPEPIDPDDARPVIDPGPTTDDHALARLELDVLNGLIDRLPEHMRTILVLAFVEDIAYAEIAEIMNVAVGTVKSRVSRARAELVAMAQRSGVVE